GSFGIVASGVAYTYASQVIEDLGLEQDVTLQQIGAYPIPETVLVEFLEEVDSVLVVEELTPFVEERVSLCAFRHGRQIPVLGKQSGHFPVEFEYSPDLVEDAVRRCLGLEKREALSVTVPELPARPPVLCSGCPHRASMHFARRVFGKKTVYCNDIGCYTLGYDEPLHACDVLLCMGASISQASGIARMTGERTVAFIGDSTFFHSGLPALANAVQAGDEITVVILDNYVTAMTGFQPSMTTGDGGSKGGAPPETAGAHPLSIEEAVRGLGVTEIYPVNPFDEQATIRRRGRAGQRAPFVVDQELCNACSLCVRMLGCPAILVVDGKYVIDPALCDGCELCAHLCQLDAIRQVAPETM
ncbi:MAG: thiamine pyrophosphate-dependent enzyme, partial [Planctomycetota bacterium]